MALGLRIRPHIIKTMNYLCFELFKTLEVWAKGSSIAHLTYPGVHFDTKLRGGHTYGQTKLPASPTRTTHIKKP
eukprot:9494686-Pyramimonas_sp.AAC.1